VKFDALMLFVLGNTISAVRFRFVTAKEISAQRKLSFASSCHWRRMLSHWLCAAVMES